MSGDWKAASRIMDICNKRYWIRRAEKRIWLYTTLMEIGRRKDVRRDVEVAGEVMKIVRSVLADVAESWLGEGVSVSS